MGHKTVGHKTAAVQRLRVETSGYGGSGGGLRLGDKHSVEKAILPMQLHKQFRRLGIHHILPNPDPTSNQQWTDK